MRNFALGLGCAVLLGTASTSWATLGVVIDEDFESYADTAALLAAWSDTGGFDATLENEIDDDGDLTPEVTGIGNFAFHPGFGGNALGVAAQDLAAPIVATETEWIQLTVDIYDNDLGTGSKRMTLGLRSTVGAVTENIVELGHYNNPFGAHHSYRAILFDSLGTPNPSWQGWDLGTEEKDVNGDGVITPDNGDTVIDPGEEPLDGDGDGILQPWHNEDDYPINVFTGAQWYTYRATIKPESVVYEIDTDYDGTFDVSVEHIDLPHTAAGFNQIRFGGPSGITSANGATFDNILLEIIAADAPALEGDLDLDGFVGITDLNLVLSNWNQDVPPGDPAADPSGDDFVGIEDLNVVLGNWNAGTPPPSVVPEPATLALLSIGGLAMLRRR